MNRRSFFLSCGVAWYAARWLPAVGEDSYQTEAQMLARRRLLESVRRLGTEGWRPREGTVVMTLPVGEARLVPVMLARGNRYLFLCHFRPSGAQVQLTVLDSQRRLVGTGPPLGDSGYVGVEFSPAVSGRYFLRLNLPADSPADAALALGYLFK